MSGFRMSGLDPGWIAAAYRASCLDELDALKPGNVHAFADGHRMAVADFVASADISAPALAEAGASVGRRVLRAVEATMSGVGQNTNLGILLLCAPLAAAAETGGALRDALHRILDGFDADDAADVFAAIRRANPGGLGKAARHDVTDSQAPASLAAAMAEAAPRDAIARAYVTGFDDLFTIGLPALARAQGLETPWRTTAVFLAYLARVPDSHVARKHGPERAEALRVEAEALLALDLTQRPVTALLACDRDWKARGLNPGTSADFTVATLFLARLLGASSERT
ncbi:triphosphoribosyl-dephospho-CoA synthase [Methylobacterium sp. J-068]|uniref:triphosphoribosyl-dephospho-CoA synthase n=1 Tax=Methylobacterium sp. J-068 TaxID=2836649 RepID=UPI001FB95E2A|nr:triphosphoribosyl-dephospho-CoA synthase [Methylobacterium sp. J-068]MCJ2035891.1 triphosphoribosyl-dephospho-CoA synthase [Methylobacterium sp. J-068]